MSNYDRIDFIIIIVLALLVAFIIGFNILQMIDSKLSSVTINVPSSQIYLKVDDNSKIHQVKPNDINNGEYIQIENELTNKVEHFGSIPDYPLELDDNRSHLISNMTNSNDTTDIINKKTIYETMKDPSYNMVNNLPLLVAPDTNVPNRAGTNSKGYYESKVKLIEDPTSPLMNLAQSNKNEINNIIGKYSLADRSKIPQVNGTFDGYNAFVNLRSDSYANITSIGKSMLSPYISYPVPS